MYLLKKLMGADPNKPQLQSSKLCHSFGRKGLAKGQFSNHCGIAITKCGNIVIADTENHRIQIFTENGHFISKFGQKGPAPDHLNCPVSIAVTNHDNILVTDTVNGCVKRFSQSGILLEILAAEGTFEHPHGLSVSHDDWIAVTDVCLNNLTILTPEGAVSKKIGTYGDGPLEFDYPSFVQFSQMRDVIVADHGNVCIKIFSFNLRPLRMISMDDFKLFDESFISLQGMTTDDQNNVLLIGNATVYILANDGRLWEVILPREGLFSPRCLVYRKGRLYVTQSGLGQASHGVFVFSYNQNDYKCLKNYQNGM